jgi:hypothetical protein
MWRQYVGSNRDIVQTLRALNHPPKTGGAGEQIMAANTCYDFTPSGHVFGISLSGPCSRPVVSAQTFAYDIWRFDHLS